MKEKLKYFVLFALFLNVNSIKVVDNDFSNETNVVDFKIESKNNSSEIEVTEESQEGPENVSEENLTSTTPSYGHIIPPTLQNVKKAEETTEKSADKLAKNLL